jgi:large subunit ribosomal protein L3
VAIELMCRKIGMTQVFVDSGECIPVTVLEAGPNVVVQKKNEEKDGYTAVQLGFEERREKLVSKPELGHTKAAGIAPQHYLAESRIAPEEAEQYEVGQKIDCSIFEPGGLVDAIGTSKGRGFSGVVKRHGFKIKKRTHGTHEAFRHAGSIGAGASPGHVIKGKKMAGQLGNERVTVKNLEVVRVDPEKNLVYVRGGVPGHNDGIVRLRSVATGSSAGGGK